MPLTVDWYDEQQTILQYDVYGFWTWEDVVKAFQRRSELIDELNRPDVIVDVIVDLQDLEHIPHHAVSRLGGIIKANYRPQIGISVIVTPNRLLWTMVSILRATFPQTKNYCSTHSIHEALVIIEDARSKRTPQSPVMR